MGIQLRRVLFGFGLQVRGGLGGQREVLVLSLKNLIPLEHFWGFPRWYSWKEQSRQGGRIAAHGGLRVPGSCVQELS